MLDLVHRRGARSGTQERVMLDLVLGEGCARSGTLERVMLDLVHWRGLC